MLFNERFDNIASYSDVSTLQCCLDLPSFKLLEHCIKELHNDFRSATIEIDDSTYDLKSTGPTQPLLRNRS